MKLHVAMYIYSSLLTSSCLNSILKFSPFYIVLYALVYYIVGNFEDIKITLFSCTVCYCCIEISIIAAIHAGRLYTQGDNTTAKTTHSTKLTGYHKLSICSVYK